MQPHPNKFTPVLISTVVMTIIAITPFLNFINLGCCAGIMIGGAAGVVYYNNRLKAIGETVQYKDGAAIGVLSGFITAIAVVIATTLLSMLVKQNPIPDIYKLIDQSGYPLPPNADEFLRKISDEYSKNGFSITLTIMTLIIDIVIYPLFGAIGAMLAVAIVGKKKNEQPE